MNLPNKLTVSRFVLTLIVVALASLPEGWLGPWPWRLAYILAIVAGLTDLLDGHLARKHNLVTDFGKLMDPLADKVFTVSCFVIFTAYGIVPAWVTILILTREFAVTGLRTLAAGKGEVIAAAQLGKFKTTAQMAALAIAGLVWIRVLPPEFWGFGWLWTAALALLAAYTIYTGVDYFYKGRNLYLHAT